MVRVYKSSIIFLCVHPSVRPSSVVRPFVCHILLNHWAEFNQTCYITSPHGKGVREQHCFLCVRSPSICPSRYLLLNHWAEFNQTCYITSPHGKNVREQHYFSVRPSSVHLSLTLSPHGGGGGVGDSTKLATSLPLMVRVCESNIIFPFVRLSICPSRYLLLNHWAEFK